jgi:hypothetical protein
VIAEYGRFVSGMAFGRGMIEKGIFELCGLIFVVFSSCFRETENFTAKSTGFDRLLCKEDVCQSSMSTLAFESMMVALSISGSVHFVTTEY